MTEICDRVLKAGGPALLFERPKGHTMPVLGNLFGTVQRVALGMGVDAADPAAALREIGPAAGRPSRSPSRPRDGRMRGTSCRC